MTIAFISDLHLTPEQPSITARFNDFIQKSGRLLTELYILGDLFDYWVGDDAADALGYANIETRLRDLVDGGTPVFFIAGNRDFLVGSDFSQRTGVQLLDDFTLISLDGKPVLLAHGDALCTDDTDYLALKATFSDPQWQSKFLAKPIQERIDYAKQVRQQSELGKQGKPLDIMDVSQQAVVDIMRQYNTERLIHGHTHRPYVHLINELGDDVRRYVLGDWDSNRSVLYYNQGKFYLKK